MAHWRGSVRRFVPKVGFLRRVLYLHVSVRVIFRLRFGPYQRAAECPGTRRIHSKCQWFVCARHRRFLQCETHYGRISRNFQENFTKTMDPALHLAVYDRCRSGPNAG